mmetsp:Transcript_14901/g.44925  ORF Transcript_14901/g.44925 Transcript_14901/m.44925 type:complete len:225 (+) Transcript_14901:446-1120(+)
MAGGGLAYPRHAPRLPARLRRCLQVPPGEVHPHRIAVDMCQRILRLDILHALTEGGTQRHDELQLVVQVLRHRGERHSGGAAPGLRPARDEAPRVLGEEERRRRRRRGRRLLARALRVHDLHLRDVRRVVPPDAEDAAHGVDKATIAGHGHHVCRRRRHGVARHARPRRAVAADADAAAALQATPRQRRGRAHRVASSPGCGEATRAVRVRVRGRGMGWGLSVG